MDEDISASLVQQNAPVDPEPILDSEIVSEPKQDLVDALTGGKGKKYISFTMAVLGSIPWFGSLLTAAANLSGAAVGLTGEKGQEQINQLLSLWVKEHEGKVKNLTDTLTEIFTRFENFGEDIQKRIESPEYLNLVRRAFRSWDQADTEEKRQMCKRLLISAGATTVAEDDLVRLFISWIDVYHESHFAVMRGIYENPEITRGALWDKIYGERPRDDSSKAGLYGYLIRELTLGGVIHQKTEVDAYGNAIKKERPKHREPASRLKKSHFDDIEPYVLTELGQDFIHYVMKDVATQIAEKNS